MKIDIRLLCASILLVPAYNILAEIEEDSDYATSVNVKDYQTKKSRFELSDNQKTALAVGGAALGAIAAGAAAYGAYQYTNADNVPTTTDALRAQLNDPVAVKELTGMLNSPTYANNPQNQQNFLESRFPELTQEEKQGILSLAEYERNNPSVLRPSQLDAINYNQTQLLPAQPLSERPAKPLPIEKFNFDI